MEEKGVKQISAAYTGKRTVKGSRYHVEGLYIGPLVSRARAYLDKLGDAGLQCIPVPAARCLNLGRAMVSLRAEDLHAREEWGLHEFWNRAS